MSRRVVLLHSAVGDSRQWSRQAAALGDRFDVVAPDLPGFGTEPMPAEPFSFVDRVVGLLPASLVGNSFGGAIALRTALASPELVDRLVLVGSGLPDWEWSEEMRDYVAREEEAVRRGDLDAAAEINLEFWLEPEHRDELRPQQRRSLELQTAHAEPEVLWPELPPLESLAVPTLVVVGDRDKEDFQQIARHIAATVPGARLEVVPGAGHLVGVDRPDELNRLLFEFLQH
ncbi:MAG TPA: alpha/beta fold hydrolase [Gaiellaceae bacterium]|nr:alpha/beta fold hydrolase [Gaiellaceae bacterium]